VITDWELQAPTGVGAAPANRGSSRHDTDIPALGANRRRRRPGRLRPGPGGLHEEGGRHGDHHQHHDRDLHRLLGGLHDGHARRHLGHRADRRLPEPADRLYGDAAHDHAADDASAQIAETRA